MRLQYKFNPEDKDPGVRAFKKVFDFILTADPTLQIPLEEFIAACFAGHIKVCAVENDEGKIEELCVFQVRNRYFVNRGLQTYVLWYQGMGAVEYASSIGAALGAAEVEYCIMSASDTAIYARRHTNG